MHMYRLSFTRTFLLGPVFFRNALTRSDVLPGAGGMPSHDPFVVNCKNCATTENQGPGA